MPKTSKTTVKLPHGYKAEISEPQIKILRIVNRESRNGGESYEGEDVVGHFVNSPRGLEQASTKIVNDYSSRMGDVSVEELKESMDQFVRSIMDPCTSLIEAMRKYNDNIA